MIRFFSPYLIKKMLKNYKLSRIIFFRTRRLVQKLFGKALLFFGLTNAQVLEAFFFGSIVLLFFRLFFRLFFNLNPYWYLNLFMYFFSICIQFKYSPLNRIRIFMVKSLKVLLGKNYWYTYSLEECYHFNMLGYTRFPPINIYKGNFFHYFFRFLFIFFIFFRLIILQIPIKFFFFNFFFTFFLIFNKFFLFSSLVSLLLLFSRLSFFVTDYNTTDLYKVVSEIEIFDPKIDYIEANWENAIILSLLAVRSFDYTEVPVRREKTLYKLSGDNWGIFDFFSRYIQYKPLFYKYSLKLGSAAIYIKARGRISQHNHYIKTEGLEGAPYRKILKINKIKPPLGFSIRKLLFGVSILTIVKSANTEKKTIVKFLQNDLTAFRPTTPQPNWFSKYFFNVSEKIEIHPTLALYVKNNFISVFNKTTYKFRSKNTFLSPYPENQTGRSIVRSATVKQIEGHENHKINDLITNLYNDGKIEPVTLEPDFFLHFIPEKLPVWVFEKKALHSFYLLFKKQPFANFILPDATNCMFTYLNPLATKNQAVEGLETAIEYISIMLTKNIPQDQFNMYIESLYLLQDCLKEIDSIPEAIFSTIEYPYVNIKTYVLREINFDLQLNPPSGLGDLPFICIKKTLLRIYPDVEDVNLKHINNIDKLSLKEGGTDNKKYVYKSLLEKGALQEIVQSKPELKSLADIQNINNKLFTPANSSHDIVLFKKPSSFD